MIEIRLSPPATPGEAYPAHALGVQPTGLVFSHDVRGSLTAEWTQRFPSGFTHPLLRAGTLVDLVLGGWRFWTGVLAEPDRGEWKFTADGLAREAEKFLALDSTAAPTTVPDTAVYQATRTGTVRPRRIPGWVYPSSGGAFPTTASSAQLDATSQAVYLSALLDDRAVKEGKVWGIDPNTRVPYFRTVPTTPTVILAPGTPGLPTSPDGQVTYLVGRRTTTVSGSTPTAWAPAKSNSAAAAAAADRWGPAERWVDLADRGVITNADAQTILNLMADAGLSGAKYTASVQLAPWQVAGVGGTALDLRLLCAGQLAGEMTMVRQHGVLDTEGVLIPGQVVDWVIGKSVYDTDTGSLTLTPYLADEQTVPEVIRKATKTGVEWVLAPANY